MLEQEPRTSDLVKLPFEMRGARSGASMSRGSPQLMKSFRPTDATVLAIVVRIPWVVAQVWSSMVSEDSA